MQTKIVKKETPVSLLNNRGLKIFIQWRRAGDPQSIDKGSHFSADSKNHHSPFTISSINLPIRIFLALEIALSLSLVSRSMVMTICTLLSSGSTALRPAPDLAPPHVFSVIFSSPLFDFKSIQDEFLREWQSLDPIHKYMPLRESVIPSLCNDSPQCLVGIGVNSCL